MTSVTRKPSASQSRISTSSTGLSSRASDADRSAAAAALNPRDATTGASCVGGRALLSLSVTTTGIVAPRHHLLASRRADRGPSRPRVHCARVLQSSKNRLPVAVSLRDFKNDAPLLHKIGGPH